jgi:hypothetical protein
VETVVQIPAGEYGEHGENAYYSPGLRLPNSSEVGSPARERIEGMISGSRIFGASDEYWLGTSKAVSTELTSLVADIFNETGLPSITIALLPSDREEPWNLRGKTRRYGRA